MIPGTRQFDRVSQCSSSYAYHLKRQVASGLFVITANVVVAVDVVAALDNLRNAFCLGKFVVDMEDWPHSQLLVHLEAANCCRQGLDAVPELCLPCGARHDQQLCKGRRRQLWFRAAAWVHETWLFALRPTWSRASRGKRCTLSYFGVIGKLRWLWPCRVGLLCVLVQDSVDSLGFNSLQVSKSSMLFD